MPKSPRSQPVDKGDQSLPSTPLLSSLRNNDELSSPLQESPIEGWKSGRARKKTFKGAEFEEKVKVKQKKGDNTDREVKKTADLSEAGHTAGNTSLEASKPSSTRKRGRPRKTPVTASPAMKVGRPAKDITGLELESQEKCQDSVHVSSLSAAHDFGAEDASKPMQREDDSADVGSGHNIPAEESSVASNTKHRENTIAGETVCSNSLTQEELSALKFSLLEQEDGHQTVATSSQIKPVDETPTDKSSVDVPVKRKRGRPRKVIKLTNDTKQEENTIPDVGSDSLPREEISDFDSSLLAQGEDGGQTEATSSQTVSKSLVEAHTHSTMNMSGAKVPTRSRPGQPIEVLKASDGAEPGKTVTPKRGRGRPRKHRPEAEMESGSPSVLKTPKEDLTTRVDKGEVTSRSGRKITRKKYNSESEEEEDNITLSEKRKKKKMAHKKSNSDEEEELEEDTESRKGRRKSLVKRDYKEEEDSTEEVTPARNRRSKVARRKDSESDYDVEETEVVKNKRGRKPLAWNESSAKTNVTIKACLRCEEQMESLKQYKRHLMTVHCAMYTEECPSGEESNRAFQHILKVLKQLRCPKCSKVFRFSQYYKHHRNWCGREEEQERCNECGHYIKAMWMGQHRQWHKKLNTKAVTLQDADSPQRASGGKRRAATASLKKIKAAVARGDEEPPSSPQQVKKSKLDGDWEGKDEGDNDDDYDDEDEEDLDVEKVPVSGVMDQALQGRPACTCAPTVLTPLVHIISNPTLNTQVPSVNDITTVDTNVTEYSTTTESNTTEYTTTENTVTDNNTSVNTVLENIAENTIMDNNTTEATPENSTTENTSTENGHLPSSAFEQRSGLLNDMRASRLNQAQLNKQAECNALTQAAVARRLQQCNTVAQANSELSRVELHKLKLECEIDKLQQEKQVLRLQASNERLRQIQLQLQLQRMGVDVSPASLGFDLDMPVSLPTIKQDSGIEDC